MGAWLEGAGDRCPRRPAAVPGLADEPAPPGPGGPARCGRDRHEQGALDLETLEVKARFDGDRVSGLVVETTQPRQGHHRGLHDRRQRRDRPLPRGQAVPGRCAGWCASRSAGSASSTSPTSLRGPSSPRSPTPGAATTSWSSAAPPTRSASPTSRWRSSSCSAAASTWPTPRARTDRRPLRPRGARLRALDGAQPPLPGPGHAAPAQGGARRRPCPYSGERAGGARRALHAAGGQAPEGRAARAQVGGRLLPRRADRRGVRRLRHRREPEGHLGASARSRRWRAAW